MTTADLSPESGVRDAVARLRRSPVEGSVVLGILPSQPQPRAAWVSLLPLHSAAPATARGDTELFVTTCQGIPDHLAEDAVLVVSELVSNAYTAMEKEPFSGIPCIEFSLRLFDAHLLIEVIDSSTRSPKPDLTYDAERESGRGLVVVDRLSQEWGYFWRNGRKVVYCKLADCGDGDLNRHAAQEWGKAS